MKRAHIVYAHPEPNSFVAAMRDLTRETLEKEGWHTSLTDLTAIDFHAVAGPGDFASRARADYLVYPLEQRHAWKNQTIDAQIAAEVEAVRNAQLLVLVFPVFWYSVPAQLKGWIDRVFLSGIFYGGTRVYDRGGMCGKRAMVVASLGGRDYMFGPGSIHGDLNDMLKHLLQGTLGYVGYSVHAPYYAYHVPYVEPSERTAMLMGLHHALEHIDSRPVLQMPSLDDFDAEFRPKVVRVPAD